MEWYTSYSQTSLVAYLWGIETSTSMKNTHNLKMLVAYLWGIETWFNRYGGVVIPR